MIFIFWTLSTLTLMFFSYIFAKLKWPILAIQFFVSILITYFLYTKNGYFFEENNILTTNPSLLFINKLILSSVFSYILSDITDLKISPYTIKYGLFSFIIPFLFGLGFYYYFYNDNVEQSISVGILYSMVAIPILFSLLKELKYPAHRSGIIIQSAIIIDIIAWFIFSTYLITFQPITILIISISLLLPFILKKLNTPNSYYGVILFILFLFTEYLNLSGVISGFMFCISSFYVGQKIRFPIPKKFFISFITYFATPFIIIYSLLQVDYSSIIDIGIKEVLLFILIPILIKVVANFIFVYHSLKTTFYSALYEALLFNARGLTEIILLNLLFSLSIINSPTYISFFIMSLISSVLPSFLPPPKNKIM